MEEKILVKSECPQETIIVVRIIQILIGIVLMATCLVWETILGDWAIFVSAALGGIITLLGLAFLFVSWKPGLYITEKKVYGTTLWGKRVDIPLDSISAVSSTSFFAGITVASSSGRISFVFLENKDKIFKIISKLIQDRQEEKKSIEVHPNEKQNPTDELKKFKELFDMGAITQEEFDAKKKQLLDL